MLQQLIDEGTENRLIPVDDWPAFADKGNLANLIQWMPIAQVAETLIQLYNARDRVKAVLYEITGIGDIMRGMTNPNETLGAQELKANFATRRIVPQQKGWRGLRATCCASWVRSSPSMSPRARFR